MIKYLLIALLFLYNFSAYSSDYVDTESICAECSSEITGTITNLTCVYKHRDNLSLDRHINPVPIFVQTCSLNYSQNNQHSPSPISLPELIPASFDIPPVNEWPLFTLTQLKLLECHLKVWKQNNPGFDSNDIITIDLSQPCNGTI